MIFIIKHLFISYYTCRVKALVTFTFSIIILLVSTPSGFLMVDYHCNKNFYETHCINKKTPKSDCHGKCELRKNSKNKELSTNSTISFPEFNIIFPEYISLSLQKEIPMGDRKIADTQQRNSIISIFYDIPYPPPEA
ncbi:MAG: hypothetical protein ACTTJM_03465 [Bergeyella cardium]